jgi:hypothetical protein
MDVSEAVLPEALPDASSVPGWLGLAIAARPSCALQSGSAGSACDYYYYY